MPIRRASTLACIVLVGVGTAAPQQAPVSNHRFVQVADGVYAAHPAPAMNVGSNTAVIVAGDGVMLVDSHITPAAARALVEDVETVTDKPVRWVVNTHHHYDHAHGNPAFGSDVTVIGHEFTRRILAAPPLQDDTYREFVEGLPGQIENLRSRAAISQDSVPLQQQLKRQVQLAEGLKEVRSSPPDVTLTQSMSVYRGDRELRLLHVGRGHTAGDVVVYLPREKILCTGDLLTAGLSYMGDAYADEWAQTLDHLEALDFDAVIPGHGEVLKGKAHLDGFRAYLKDFWEQVAALRREGVPATDAAKRVDLRRHQPAFPSITAQGADPAAVARQYRVMLERERQ